MGTHTYTFADDKALAAWEKLTAVFDTSIRPGQLSFLKPSHIQAAAAYLEFDADLTSALIAGLSMFSTNPELERLLWQYHCLLKQRRSMCDFKQPVITPSCHPAIDLFHVYALLSVLDAVRACHRERGVDEGITKDTLLDLNLWARQFHERHGRWGLDQFGWLANHFIGELFKLGRLQFKFETFPYPLRAFRHRQSREPVIICESGLRFRADGQFADADGRESSDAWLSELVENAGAVSAEQINPRGLASRRKIVLPDSEWECVLRMGDPTLGIHIAATGPMTHAACGASFDMAVKFFPRRFPERQYKAFTCSSWLLDPQFEKHLPATSNITLFLKEFYLHPIPKASSAQTFERVFGFGVTPGAKLESLPRGSSLQRQVIQHIENGGLWRGGGAVLFPEDLAWGQQVYWNQAK